MDHPEPGFSNTVMGLTGLFAVAGAGLLKTIYIDPNTRLDITPQDFAPKNMMYFTLLASNIYERTKPSEAPVYMTSSDPYFNLTFEENINLVDDFRLWEKAAYEKNLLLPGVHCTDNRFVYMFLVRKKSKFFKNLMHFQSFLR